MGGISRTWGRERLSVVNLGMGRLTSDCSWGDFLNSETIQNHTSVSFHLLEKMLLLATGSSFLCIHFNRRPRSRPHALFRATSEWLGSPLRVQVPKNHILF